MSARNSAAKNLSHVTPRAMFGSRVEACHASLWSGWFVYPGPEGGIFSGYFDADGLRKSPGGRLVDERNGKGLLEMVRWIAEAEDQANELEAFGFKPSFVDLVTVSPFGAGYRVDVDSTTFWERINALAAAGTEDAVRLLEQSRRMGEGPFLDR